MLLLPPQTWSRGYLVLTDLLQLVFVEGKFVRRRLWNRESCRAALEEWLRRLDCRPVVRTMA